MQRSVLSLKCFTEKEHDVEWGMTFRGRPVVNIEIQSDESEFLERLSRKRNAPASDAE